ncbi:hypothetical protein ACFSUS_04650 [Spirosoma soli]|uniref:DUF104 domain-containing protein n=1 Tax=Spirosoma soli TaxID=1770529 RepID=A0ABW5M046_9BACT
MLVSVEGVYQDGQIRLNDKVPFEKETKVIVTFLEDQSIDKPAKKRLTLDDFSFRKSQEALKDYKGSFSDAVIEERRESR